MELTLSRKSLRTIKRHLSHILSDKGVLLPQNITEYKALGVFPVSINYKGIDLFLTDVSKQYLNIVVGILHEEESIDGLAAWSDINSVVLSELEFWANKELDPSPEAFVRNVLASILERISTFEFICRVRGLTPPEKGFSLNLKRVLRFSPQILDNVGFNDPDLRELLYNEYDGEAVIIGGEYGTEEIARKKFYRNCELYLSVIRLYSWLAYEKGNSNIHLKIINTTRSAYGPATSAHWKKSDRVATINFKCNTDQPIVVDDDFISIVDHYNFNEACNLVESVSRCCLDNALTRAIYWFGEAHEDKEPSSSFIKMWSAIEGIFSVEDSGITSQVSNGIAWTITHGPYRLTDYGNLGELTTKATKWYGTRCKIVHSANYTEVSPDIHYEFSKIVAWVIVSLITARNHSGYSIITSKRKLKTIIDKEIDCCKDK